MSGIHINRGPAMREVIRELDGQEPRWCFTCRANTRFLYIVAAPAEQSHYGPTPSIECEHGHIDGDMFPGRERVWE